MIKYQKIQKFAFSIFVAMVLTILIAYNFADNNLGIDGLRIYIKGLGIWASLIFTLIYALGTIFIPSTPFMALAGVLFGFKMGFLYTVIGGFISAVVTFYISRILGYSFTEKILRHDKFKKMYEYNNKIEQHGLQTLIILRILPIMPFNVLNMLMGVSKIKTKNYIVGTIIGLLPSNIIAVYFGSFVFDINIRHLSMILTVGMSFLILYLVYKNIRKNFLST